MSAKVRVNTDFHSISLRSTTAAPAIVREGAISALIASVPVQVGQMGR